MQVLMIAGNVGKDAVLRRTQSDDAVLGFSLAVNNGKDRGGAERPATWYDCAIYGKRAEALQDHIRKGSKLALSGRPTVRVHEGKAYLGIVVSELTFMGGGEQSGGQDQGGYGSAGADQSQGSGYGAGGRPDFEDSIPFAPEFRV